eukprot:156511_1
MRQRIYWENNVANLDQWHDTWGRLVCVTTKTLTMAKVRRPLPTSLDLVKTPSLTLGRTMKRSDVVVHDQRVSARHLLIAADDSTDTVTVQDVSTNGTRVNGKRIPKGESVVLQDGDLISIGTRVIVYKFVMRPPAGRPSSELVAVERPSKRAKLYHAKDNDSKLLTTLHGDLLIEMLLFLSLSDLCVVARSCQRLNGLSTNNTVWRELSVRHFRTHVYGDLSTRNASGFWKQQYLSKALSSSLNSFQNNLTTNLLGRRCAHEGCYTLVAGLAPQYAMLTNFNNSTGSFVEACGSCHRMVFVCLKHTSHKKKPNISEKCAACSEDYCSHCVHYVTTPHCSHPECKMRTRAAQCTKCAACVYCGAKPKPVAVPTSKVTQPEEMSDQTRAANSGISGDGESTS